MATFTELSKHSLQELVIAADFCASTLGLCLQTGLESARDCDGEWSNPHEAKTVCVAVRATSLNVSEPESQTVAYEIKYVTAKGKVMCWETEELEGECIPCVLSILNSFNSRTANAEISLFAILEADLDLLDPSSLHFSELCFLFRS
jgi:hypothetical protein